VHDIGARTVDVYALRRGRLRHYWVDELGQPTLAETGPVDSRYFVDRAVKAVYIAIWVAFAFVIFGVEDNKGRLLLGLVAAVVAVAIIGAINASAGSLERRVRRLDRDGHPWFEIRTREEDDDGD
jgi:hypothetical protein